MHFACHIVMGTSILCISLLLLEKVAHCLWHKTCRAHGMTKSLVASVCEYSNSIEGSFSALLDTMFTSSISPVSEFLCNIIGIWLSKPDIQIEVV